MELTISSFVRNLGGTLGLAIAGTIMLVFFQICWFVLLLINTEIILSRRPSQSSISTNLSPALCYRVHKVIFQSCLLRTLSMSVMCWRRHIKRDSVSSSLLVHPLRHLLSFWLFGWCHRLVWTEPTIKLWRKKEKSDSMESWTKKKERARSNWLWPKEPEHSMGDFGPGKHIDYCFNLSLYFNRNDRYPTPAFNIVPSVLILCAIRWWRWWRCLIYRIHRLWYDPNYGLTLMDLLRRKYIEWPLFLIGT